MNIRALNYLWDNIAYTNFLYAASGLSIGMWFALIFFQGHLSVFFHELKHSIVSNLAGNRSKGMKIKRDTGLFSYEYTRQSAKYNALIALAPYFFPLFSIPALLVGLVFFIENHQHLVLVLAIGFGCDLFMNIRDISPVQTDITNITGGYYVGVLFIVAFNLVLLTYFMAWSFQEVFGLKVLFAYLWEMIVRLVWHYRRL